MIYNLLKRIQNLLASKPSGTKEEQEILSLVSQALPAMLNGHDTETLAANELLVRICPDTKRPVLVCHNGNGQCLCLHNGTTEEDAVDVDLWLRSNGRECNGYNKLQEAVVDLAYNAGADNLWEDRTPVPSMPRSSSGRKNSRLSMRALIGMRRTTSLPSTGFTRKRQNK